MLAVLPDDLRRLRVEKCGLPSHASFHNPEIGLGVGRGLEPLVCLMQSTSESRNPPESHSVAEDDEIALDGCGVTGIILVEDDEILLRVLCDALKRMDDMHLGGAYLTAEGAIHEADWASAHVALIDLELPGMSGVQLIHWLRENHPHVICAVHTIHDQRDLVFRALEEGAFGYVLKGTPVRELCGMLAEMRIGRAHLSPSIAGMLIESFRKGVATAASEPLSARELELLELLADGFSYKETAARLGISFHTVQTHVSRIYRKLHAVNRREAVQRARLLGLM